jgi:NADPH:quinone reductase-like Zn-dependent oxidoreductase
MRQVKARPDRFERAVKFVIDGLKSGALDPVIDKVFTLDQIVEAHRYLESNQQIGKIVVKV